MEKFVNENNLSLITEYDFRNVNFVLWCKNWFKITDKKLVEFRNKNLTADEALLEQLKMVLLLDGYNIGINNLETAVDVIMLNYERYCMWARANGKNYLSTNSFYYKVKSYVKQKDSFFSAVVKAIREFYGWQCESLPLPLKELYNEKLYKFGLSNKHKDGETYKEMNRRYLNTLSA